MAVKKRPTGRSNIVRFAPSDDLDDDIFGNLIEPDLLLSNLTLPDGREMAVAQLFEKVGMRLLSMSEDEVISAAYELLGAGKTGRTSSPTVSRWPLAASFRGRAETLETLFEAEFTTAQLRELARFWGVTLKGTIKTTLAAQVIAELQKRIASLGNADGPDLLQALPQEQAEFMRRLFTAWDADIAFPRSLAKELLRTTDDKRVNEMLDALRKHGLVFPSRSYQYMVSLRDAYYQVLPLGTHSARVPVMPTVLQPLAKPPAPKEVHDSLLPLLGAVDRIINAQLSTPIQLSLPAPTHKDAARTVWLRNWPHNTDEADRVLKSRPGWVPDPRSGISVPPTMPLPVESAQSLESQTGVPATNAKLIYSLLATLQISAPPEHAESRHSRINPEIYEHWIGLTPEAQLRMLWTAFTETCMASIELNALSTMHAEKPLLQLRAIGANDLTPDQLLADACGLRRFVARALRGLPMGQWFEFSGVLREMFLLRASCAHTLKTTDDWWFAQGTVRLNPLKFEEWLRSTGLLIEQMLIGALHAFGALRIAHDKSGAVSALCVTELGAWLFGASGSMPAVALPAPRAEEPAAWLDDTRWRITPSPARVELITLSRKLGESGDTPFVYQLTMRSIEHALAQGINLEVAAATFARFGLPWPAAAREMAAELTRNFGRVRVYESMSVITLTDDLALRELMASTSLPKHVLVQISPRAVAVHDAELDKLIDEWIAKGHTPRLVMGDEVHSG